MRLSVLAVVTGLVLSSCGGDGHASDAGSSPTPTAAPGTDPGSLVITFDGDSCDYLGPDQASLDDEITLTVVNESSDTISAGIKPLPSDRVYELVQLVGTDFEPFPESAIRPALFLQITGAGEDTISAFLALEGIYVVDCTQLDGGARVRHWWPATLEVIR